MKKQDNEKATNTITVDGVTFKTTGNIVFADAQENPFHLAQSTMLDQFDGLLENGMQHFLKKAVS